MLSSSEFEVKIPYSESTASALGLLSSRANEENVIDDLYLDTSDRRLYPIGIFVRVRNERVGEVKYTHDTSDSSHIECEEYPFSYPLDPAETLRLDALLRRLAGEATGQPAFAAIAENLEPFVRLRKRRTNFNFSDFVCSIDEVDGLGKFIEIEARSSAGVRRLKEMLESGHITNLPVGYVELWLRKHDFQEYLRGRYVLPQDHAQLF